MASLAIDRALGLLALFVVAGAVGAFACPSADVRVRNLIAFGWMMVACGTIGLAVLFTPPLNSPFLALVRGWAKLEALFNELIAMASAYRDRLGVIVLALGPAVAGHAMYVGCFYLACKALFGPEAPTLMQHFLVVPLLLFSMAIPMPFGAMGVTEQVSKTLFQNLAGFASGDLAMLGYRAIMYAD